MRRTLVLLIAAFAASSLFADTIELANGRLLEGDFVGSSNGIIMFNTGEGIEAFPENEVVGMWFSSGVATRDAEVSAGPAPTITIPAGTRLVIRMSDSVDSKRHASGHRFNAQLEGAVVVDGVTVLPRGTIIQGRIASSQQSGRAVGSSSMSIELNRSNMSSLSNPLNRLNISIESNLSSPSRR